MDPNNIYAQLRPPSRPKHPTMVASTASSRRASEDGALSNSSSNNNNSHPHADAVVVAVVPLVVPSAPEESSMNSSTESLPLVSHSGMRRDHWKVDTDCIYIERREWKEKDGFDEDWIGCLARLSFLSQTLLPPTASRARNPFHYWSGDITAGNAEISFVPLGK